jgi:hypothetical protein
LGQSWTTATAPQVEFMRAWPEQVYGVPPEQVVGSTVKTKFEMRDGTPVLVRLPEVYCIDAKVGKPVGIHRWRTWCACRKGRPDRTSGPISPGLKSNIQHLTSRVNSQSDL